MIDRWRAALARRIAPVPRTRGGPVFDAVSALRRRGLQPTLMDVGAAGASPAHWRSLAAASRLIGFEPDARNPNRRFGEGFADAIAVDKIVCPNDDDEVYPFHITRYPSCSSALPPDADSLASWSFAPYFAVERTTTLPATSVNRILRAYGLDQVDWIKLDAQGLDLKILQSIDDAAFERVLAVDLEAGIVDAYRGEDLFPACHIWLAARGFWLAALDQQAYVRIRPARLAALTLGRGGDPARFMRRLPTAPTALEGLYLRDLAWHARPDCGADTLLTSMIFAITIGQTPFAYDLSALYNERFGDDSLVSNIQWFVENSIAKID